MYLTREVLVAVNLRPLEVYRALLGNPERIFPREECGSAVSLPCLSSRQREMTRERTKALFARAKTWRNASEKRRVIVRGRTKFAREIFSESGFRRRDCAIVS